MTVDELLRRWANAYGIEAKRLEAWAPIFRATFEKREGPHLGAAFTACMASFDASRAKKAFPTPPDIEAHMPSLKLVSDDPAGPPIREKLDQRHARSRVLLTDWEQGQGAKIKAQRAPQLYAACWLEAFDQAKAKALDDRVSGIRLEQPKINECFQRAISTERVRRFGRPSADMHRHWQQLVEIATEWKLEIAPEWWSEDTAKSLAEKAVA